MIHDNSIRINMQLLVINIVQTIPPSKSELLRQLSVDIESFEQLYGILQTHIQNIDESSEDDPEWVSNIKQLISIYKLSINSSHDELIQLIKETKTQIHRDREGSTKMFKFKLGCFTNECIRKLNV